jgi:hypothetical protein
MSVEVKFVASEKDEEVVRSALGLFDQAPEYRDVYFFDTGDIKLFKRGIVLRARQTHDAKDDSTVKLRPFPEREEGRWKDAEGFELEMDVVGRKPVLSAKVSVEQRRGEIEEVSEHRRPIRKLFSDIQEQLISAYRPGGISWNDLTTLGPAKVHKWRVESKGFPHEVSVEEWLLHDSEDLVELSIRVTANSWLEATEEFKAFLANRKIHISADQQAKTRSVLEFFAQHPSGAQASPVIPISPEE